MRAAVTEDISVVEQPHADCPSIRTARALAAEPPTFALAILGLAPRWQERRWPKE
jgi:hypothetical protein